MARILLLGGDGGRSGVPRHIEHLARALAASHELVIASDRDRGGYGFVREMGLQHLELEGLRSSVSPWRFAAAARRLRRAIGDCAPDLVWAHARMSLPLARLALWGRRAPLVVTYHGLPFGAGHGALRSALGRAFEVAGLGLGPRQHVVFLTEEDRAAFPAWLLRRHRVAVLPNASDLGMGRPAPPPEGAFRLVMLTRDSRQKNLDLAASLLAVLPGDVRLDLYGMGTADPALAARFAAILGAKGLGRVGFHGEVARVGPALAASDALLVTSRYEGLSIAMIEAMEAGRLVISTPVGGTGLLGRNHPGFVAIDPAHEGAGVSAARILEALHAFRAGKPVPEQIHAAWAENHAPDRWAGRARDLVDEVLLDQ